MILTLTGCGSSPSAGTSAATSASITTPPTTVETTTTIEQTAARRPRIGDQFTLGQLRLTVLSVEDPLTPARMQPQPGNRLVSITYEARSQDPAAAGLGPADLPSVELGDAAGANYSPEHGRVGVVSGRRTPAELPPGDSAHSTLVFEVPDAATGLGVTFRSGEQTVTVALE